MVPISSYGTNRVHRGTSHLSSDLLSRGDGESAPPRVWRLHVAKVEVQRLVVSVRTDLVSGDPSLFDGIFPSELLVRRRGTGRDDPSVLIPRHMPEFLMSNRDGIHWAYGAGNQRGDKKRYRDEVNVFVGKGPLGNLE